MNNSTKQVNLRVNNNDWYEPPSPLELKNKRAQAQQMDPPGGKEQPLPSIRRKKKSANQQHEDDDEKESIAAKMVAVSCGYLKVQEALEIVQFPPDKIGNPTIHKRIRRLAKHYKHNGIPSQSSSPSSGEQEPKSTEGARKEEEVVNLHKHNDIPPQSSGDQERKSTSDTRKEEEAVMNPYNPISIPSPSRGGQEEVLSTDTGKETAAAAAAVATNQSKLEKRNTEIPGSVERVTKKDPNAVERGPHQVHQSSTLRETRLHQDLQTEYKALNHTLVQAEKSTVEVDEQNRHSWRVFVTVKKILDMECWEYAGESISEVSFFLPLTYVPRVVKKKEPPFEIERIGGGYICVGIAILLKDEKEKITVFHDLDLSTPKTSHCIQHGDLEIEYGSLHFTVPEMIASQAEGMDYFDLEVLNEIENKRDDKRQQILKTKNRYDKLLKGWERISEFLAEIPKEHHGMALGAFLAGIYRGNLDVNYLTDLYIFATQNLRYIVLDKSTRAQGSWREYVSNWNDVLSNGDEQELERAFSLSTPLPYNQRIDIFVCHCWSDDGTIKADLLEKISRDFETQHGRLPLLWIDMFCIPQKRGGKKDIGKSVEALPLFLKASDTVAVLLSQTLLTRLWCLVEIYTAYILSPRSGGDVGFEVYSMDDTFMQSKSVDITEAKCGLDQDVLFQNLRDAPGGLQAVEWGVNASLKVASKGKETENEAS